MPDAFVLGMNGKAYYDSSGNGVANPTWVEMGNVRDVTQNLETGTSDVTTRTNAGWRAVAATLKDGTVEFEMVWNTEDAAFTAIQLAHLNSTNIACAFMDGDIDVAGSQGLVADFAVTNFSRAEPLEEAMMTSVTLQPGFSTTPPVWTTVEAT